MMMFVKQSLVLFVCLPFVSAFRPPENVQANVKLPEIKGKNGTPKVVSTKPEDGTTTTSGLMTYTGTTQPRADPFGASQHKKWGIDKDCPTEYWNDSRIHTLGNVGFFGAIHAFLAPISTKVIDMVAYNGTDVRFKVAQELSRRVKASHARVADLCCGAGFSTRALKKAFPDAETVVGIDTSLEMISMAKFLSHHIGFFLPLFQFFSARAATFCSGCAATFARANAENTLFESKSFDLVTIMYAFHEAPMDGRHRILQEAHRILQPGGMVAVIDISTEYTPSKSMLAGEPYVIEYQQNIHKQLKSMRGFDYVGYNVLVPKHVGMWLLRRSGANTWA